MRFPEFDGSYEHRKVASVAHLALLNHFCKLAALDIPDEKLREFLDEGMDLTSTESEQGQQLGTRP